MGHRPIQQKNSTLKTEIAILNLERMAYWNFKFIGNKWKMAHTMVCPDITLIFGYCIVGIFSQNWFTKFATITKSICCFEQKFEFYLFFLLNFFV